MTREPLVLRAAIVAAITALIHALVVLGVLHMDANAEAAVGGAIDLIGTAVLIAWTRSAVTPVADPRIPAIKSTTELVDPYATPATPVEGGGIEPGVAIFPSNN